MYFFRSFMCIFRCNMISARHQWRRVCSLRCRCWFYTNHPFSEENFCHIVCVPWLVNTWIFRASGMIFSPPYPLFLLPVFLTAALLDTNHIYCCFYTFRRTKNYDSGLVCDYDPFGKKWHLNRRLALRKPLDPSCLSLFSFFPFILHFYVLCRRLFTFAPCWFFFILMDPNGSPLQVINPVGGDYNSPRSGHRVARLIRVHIPSRTPRAWQPTCLPAWDPLGSPQTNLSFGPRAPRLKGPGQERIPGAESDWVIGGGVRRSDPRSYTRANKRTRTDMSHFR